MSSSQVLTFAIGAAAGVCAASALLWTVKREKAELLKLRSEHTPPAPEVTNGTAPEEAAEAAPAAEAPVAPVPAEDRPADAPESCPGVSSSLKQCLGSCRASWDQLGSVGFVGVVEQKREIDQSFSHIYISDWAFLCDQG